MLTSPQVPLCSEALANTAFVNNAGFGPADCHLHKGQIHDYVPDLDVRLARDGSRCLMIERQSTTSTRWNACLELIRAGHHWTRDAQPSPLEHR
jgi:hypothetical protein